MLVVGTSMGHMGVELGELPPGTRVVELDPDPAVALSPGVEEIEFLVISWAIRPRLPEILARATKLKVMQTLSAGLDKVKPVKGVTLCRWRLLRSRSLVALLHKIVHTSADWVLSVILCMERQLLAFWDCQKEGRWNHATQQMIRGEATSMGPMTDLDAKTALIVGHGSIGRAVEARLHAFGTATVGISRTARPGVHAMADLDRLLPAADYVILLLPLTPETTHVADAAFLAKVKPGALLINAGRGPLVDTPALEAALREGRLRAALDVTEPEPLPDGHSLWSAPNLLVTPHVAGSVARWKGRVFRLVNEQVWRYARGEPLINVATAGY